MTSISSKKVDRNYVWELEHRERASRIDTLAYLAEALEISLPEFIRLIQKENERLTRRRRK